MKLTVFSHSNVVQLITFFHIWFQRQIKWRNSITGQYVHIQILWVNSNVLLSVYICVSCHLVPIHETAAWECDRIDIPTVYVRYWLHNAPTRV